MKPFRTVLAGLLVAVLAAGSLPGKAEDLAPAGSMPQAFLEEFAAQYGGIRRLPAAQREAARAASEKAWGKMNAADRQAFIDKIRKERTDRLAAQEAWFASLSTDQRAQLRAEQLRRGEAQRALLLSPLGEDPGQREQGSSSR